jgi:hypothetical protein
LKSSHIYKYLKAELTDTKLILKHQHKEIELDQLRAVRYNFIRIDNKTTFTDFKVLIGDNEIFTIKEPFFMWDGGRDTKQLFEHLKRYLHEKYDDDEYLRYSDRLYELINKGINEENEKKIHKLVLELVVTTWTSIILASLILMRVIAGTW